MAEHVTCMRKDETCIQNLGKPAKNTTWETQAQLGV